MTHTLHPEIEALIDKIMDSVKVLSYLDDNKNRVIYVTAVEMILNKCIKPTDLKDNEPLPEKDDLNLEPGNIVEICMYDSVGQPWIKGMFLRKDGDMYVVSHKSDQEYTGYFERQHIRKLRIGREGGKQSIPKIEKLYATKENMKHSEATPLIWKKVNELIDYITNTLPTTKSNDQ